ncbi:MAG: penicillin-binding protein 2 [Candidatus Parcubacteria bacterium]|nr:MAG: penicillin-binding protein 2 [Candidatus Parcubacteria bacterium]
MWGKKRFANKFGHEITPDEALPEAMFVTTNDEDAFRVEVPLTKNTAGIFVLATALLLVIVASRAFWLQIVHGQEYAALAKSNVVASAIVPAPRAVVVDREGREIAGNAAGEDGELLRTYAYPFALAHLIGYVSPPKKDASGHFYQWNFKGVAGAEKAYDEILRGEDGLMWYETSAQGDILTQRMVQPPRETSPLRLTIDAELTQALYTIIQETAQERGFVGGSGVLLRVDDGSVLAATNYPSFDQRPFGNPASSTEAARELARPHAAHLPRAWAGRYAPGSTFKPFVGVSALSRGVITPATTIYSDGKLVVPNPYNPAQPTIYRDWGAPAHGANDITRALAFSSNVFFMSVAGGNPPAGIPTGIGITNLAEDLRAFGFLDALTFAGTEVPSGVIPTPQWKEKIYGTRWRLGDTYLTAIGQFGVQVTPLSLARAVGSIATGKLVRPCLTEDECASHTPTDLPFPQEALTVVRKGMRRAVEEGTARGLHLPFVTVAAKTGTAELGTTHTSVNSLVIGFFPYEHPRYAFAVVMEQGPATNTIGGVYVMANLLLWMRDHAPHYLEE